MQAGVRLRRIVTLVSAGAVVAAGLVPTAAVAETLPAVSTSEASAATPEAALPATVAADALPTAQMNGVAWNQLVVGSTVYVAGSFTAARPAGSALGVNEVPRGNMLAYDLATGVLRPSFAPMFNGEVLDLAASPDGRTIYAAGAFTSVDGLARYRIAALDAATGGTTSPVTGHGGMVRVSVVA